MKILVLNSGSSSLKYQLIDMENEKVLAKGNYEKIGARDSFVTHKVGGEKYTYDREAKNHEEAISFVLDQFTDAEHGVIDSLDDLEDGFFGVLEPDPQKAKKAETTEKSVCIVPAFLFDENGYRLGYGKGYYDRFLSKFEGKTVGICYDENIRNSLMHGKFDRPVGLIVTEKRIVDLL